MPIFDMPHASQTSSRLCHGVVIVQASLVAYPAILVCILGTAIAPLCAVSRGWAYYHTDHFTSPYPTQIVFGTENVWVPAYPSECLPFLMPCLFLVRWMNCKNMARIYYSNPHIREGMQQQSFGHSIGIVGGSTLLGVQAALDPQLAMTGV